MLWEHEAAGSNPVAPTTGSERPRCSERNSNKAMKAPTLALAALIFTPLMAQAPSATTEYVGKPMPAFTMKGLDGKTLTNANLKGKVVLLDFWATWCGPCKAISPMIEKLHKAYKGKAVAIYGANVWERGDKNGAKARAYAKEHKYTYPMTFGNETLATKLRIEGIPTLLVMDKKGVVRNVYVGFDPKNEAKLRAVIDGLLK